MRGGGGGGGDGIVITKPLAWGSYHAVLRTAVSDPGMGDWPWVVSHRRIGVSPELPLPAAVQNGWVNRAPRVAASLRDALDHVLQVFDQHVCRRGGGAIIHSCNNVNVREMLCTTISVPEYTQEADI